MKYFAYGSNLDESRFRKRLESGDKKYPNCLGKYTILGQGILEGYSLVFNKISYNGSGKANLESSNDDKKVEGIIYEIDQCGIDRLDIDEGVCNRDYLRKKISVNFKNEEVWCFVYISDRIDSHLKPNKEYLKHLLTGKKFFSVEYFNKLSNTLTKD